MGFTNLLYCFSEKVKAVAGYSNYFIIVEDVLAKSLSDSKEYTLSTPAYFFTFLSSTWY